MGIGWCLIVLLVTVCGCGKDGPAYGAVQGKVTMAGQPVTDAIILFENTASGIILWAELDKEGTYLVRTHDAVGLPEGHYRVAVQPRLGADADPEATSAIPGAPVRVSPIPTRYHHYETSGLTANVQAGQDAPFHFDLSAP